MDDLGRVIDRCGRYFEVDDSDQQVFFEAIVSGYGRSFQAGQSARGKGPRRAIAEVVNALDPDLRRAHDELKSLRGQHVGHRVDKNEQMVMTALVKPDDASFYDLYILLLRALKSDELVRATARLAEHLHAELSKVYDAEMTALAEDCETTDWSSRL